MNIVERAIDRVGGQAELARRLSKITRHPYKQGHVSYWVKQGGFPADIAGVVSIELFGGSISAFEASPTIKRAVG